MLKSDFTIEEMTVRRPDFIPENQEHLYPSAGGIFCDFVPEGQRPVDVHGPTYDATVSLEPVPVPVEETAPKGTK